MRQRPPYREEIDLHIAAVEPHTVVIGNNAPSLGAIDDAAEHAQARAQGAAWIISDVTEHRAEAVAAVRSPRDREIDE
jgi:hypothetical protein